MKFATLTTSVVGAFVFSLAYVLPSMTHITWDRLVPSLPGYISFLSTTFEEEQSQAKVVDENAILAGLVLDPSIMSDNVLDFIAEMTCFHSIQAHIVTGAEAEVKSLFEKRYHLMIQSSFPNEYHRGQCADVNIVSQPDHSPNYGKSLDKMNRIERLRELREFQKNLLKERLYGVEDLDGAVIILVDFDLGAVPFANEVMNHVEDLKSGASHVDVLCANGQLGFGDEDRGRYYDTFSTVLLPDTFVYPVIWREVQQQWPSEDPSFIIVPNDDESTNNESFTSLSLFQWLQSQGRADFWSENEDKTGQHSTRMRPVPVRSCFGGMAIYRASKFFDERCTYSHNSRSIANAKYRNQEDKEACEHLLWNQCMASVDTNFLPAIQPDMITTYKHHDGTAVVQNVKFDADEDEKVTRILQKDGLTKAEQTLSFVPTFGNYTTAPTYGNYTTAPTFGNFSSAPSKAPTRAPSTLPSVAPSMVQSGTPTDVPSGIPSDIPSTPPTEFPSQLPSADPSSNPTSQPSRKPSEKPSTEPSPDPSISPSSLPSTYPSTRPSNIPSSQPSDVPSKWPTELPSDRPTSPPSDIPSEKPSAFPSNTPSQEPTIPPSRSPSSLPSKEPSGGPSLEPSDNPSLLPSDEPSQVPSSSSIPSSSPSICHENPDDEFFYKVSLRYPNKPVIKTCAWLASNEDEKKELCAMTEGFHDIPPAREVCVRLCNACYFMHPSTVPSHMPSQAPSLSLLPSSHPSMCHENPNDVFFYRMRPNKPKQPVIKTCAWLASKEDKRAHVCSMTKGFNDVPPAREVCLRLCKSCYFMHPSSAPSQFPSSSPSMMPSSRPSISSFPSSQPSICHEDPNDEFFYRMKPNKPNQPVIKTCAWLTFNEDKRVQICSMTEGFDDVPPAREVCLRLCKSCYFMHPSSAPSTSPSFIPSEEPSVSPTDSPTALPSSSPSKLPSSSPSDLPSLQPSSDPSTLPSASPSMLPTSEPSFSPSATPSDTPSSSPSLSPTTSPSLYPSDDLSTFPSAFPSFSPTVRPSSSPSVPPTTSPSTLPSTSPSATPSSIPSSLPSLQPSNFPSLNPSDKPSSSPSHLPSMTPSDKPSTVPSLRPSDNPSVSPSSFPSSHPTSELSSSPSRSPSSQPSTSPSISPSTSPSSNPSASPSETPSDTPSSYPTHNPSLLPSVLPSSFPTIKPSAMLSDSPSCLPSSYPSVLPSAKPSTLPSSQPSNNPAAFPSNLPTSKPSNEPSISPSTNPTLSPSGGLTLSPFTDPSRSPSSAPSNDPSRFPSDGPSLEMSATPTLSPSNIPTKQIIPTPSTQPSDIPIIVPSQAPSIEACHENPDDEFFYRMRPNKPNQPVIKTCKWLASNQDKMQEVCKMTEGFGGFPPAREVCLRLCNTCHFMHPSSAPSPSPSFSPLPSVTPSQHPSISSSPTEGPSMSPTWLPSVPSFPSNQPSICHENPDDEFFYRMRPNRPKQPVIKTCAWLASKEDKRAHVCSMTKGFNDVPPAREVCLRLCKSCYFMHPSSAPSTILSTIPTEMSSE